MLAVLFQIIQFQSMSSEKIREKVSLIPSRPGCYIWKGSPREESSSDHDRVLYVGKASNLRSRVRQYLNTDEYKTVFLMRRVRDIDWVVTSNENEALLLENTLIKKHNPPYNIRLKDDKKYPYLSLTMSEPFPRLVLTRRKNNAKNLYFGPFSDAGAARRTMNLIHSIFPVRKRPLKLPLKTPVRPCLNYHIGRCWAPCTGKIDKEEYRTMIHEVKAFLEGRSDEVISDLKARMQQYAADLEYEKAARIRNILNDIETTSAEQNVEIAASDDNFDIAGLHYVRISDLADDLQVPESELNLFDDKGNPLLGQVILLRIRNGRLVSKMPFSFSSPVYSDESAVENFYSGFFRDYYLRLLDIPPVIYLSHPFHDAAVWSQALSEKKQITLNIVEPEDSSEKPDGLIKMALTNARHSLRERVLSEKMRNQKIGLRQIQKFLDLPGLPQTIECYDISNIQGSEAVGAGVMLKDGLPHKNGYRRYRIKTIEGADDPAMMNEVLNRRMKAFQEKKNCPPDLIIIDGGITQLKAALRARDAAGFNIPMAGLAKKEEELYTENGEIRNFDSDSPGMMILRLARDEAHRFGVAYHRNLRMKRNLSSILDPIKGIGEKKRNELMRELRKIDLGRFSEKKLSEHLQKKTSLNQMSAESVARRVLSFTEK